MKGLRTVGWCCLIVLLACERAAFARELDTIPGAPVVGGKTENDQPGTGPSSGKQGSVNEMREWLNRRNMERKQMGLAGPGAFKKHSAALNPRLRPDADRLSAKSRDGEAEQASGSPILHIGRGPDGRIRHRYIINDEGADQLQVYTGSGYNPLKPETDEEKWARLTPRGRQLWFGGSTPRKPVRHRSQTQSER